MIPNLLAIKQPSVKLMSVVKHAMVREACTLTLPKRRVFFGIAITGTDSPNSKVKTQNLKSSHVLPAMRGATALPLTLNRVGNCSIILSLLYCGKVCITLTGRFKTKFMSMVLFCRARCTPRAFAVPIAMIPTPLD